MDKRVFVVCEPIRVENGHATKAVDVSPAGKWGRIIVILQSTQSLIAPAQMIQTITEKLKDFCDDDYLVPLGDPVVMSVVASIAARNNGGRVRYLKWDRRNMDYQVIQTSIGV